MLHQNAVAALLAELRRDHEPATLQRLFAPRGKFSREFLPSVRSKSSRNFPHSKLLFPSSSAVALVPHPAPCRAPESGDTGEVGAPAGSLRCTGKSQLLRFNQAQTASNAPL